MNLASEIISELSEEIKNLDKRISFVYENVIMVRAAFKEIRKNIIEKYGTDSEVLENLKQIEILVNVLRDNVEETYSLSHNFVNEKL